jgi:hypothetical protein
MGRNRRGSGLRVRGRPAEQLLQRRGSGAGRSSTYRTPSARSLDDVGVNIPSGKARRSSGSQSVTGYEGGDFGEAAGEERAGRDRTVLAYEEERGVRVESVPSSNIGLGRRIIVTVRQDKKVGREGTGRQAHTGDIRSASKHYNRYSCSFGECTNEIEKGERTWL